MILWKEKSDKGKWLYTGWYILKKNIEAHVRGSFAKHAYITEFEYND